MNTITIQPSARVDGLDPDGAERTQLPYPFHVEAETGLIQRQDFWRGKVFEVIGFQKDLAKQRIDLTWARAARRPLEILGKYTVTADVTGNKAVWPLAIAEVLLNGERGRFLVGGNNRWGQGLTLAEAKTNFTEHGGSLSTGYEIVHFGPETEFGGVDNMGRYHWVGPEPEAKTVAPRPIRRK